MQQTGLLYRLVDPIDGMPRYVGQTVKKLGTRLSKHVSDSRYLKTHVSNWIKKLVSAGYKPEIQIICTSEIALLDCYEVYYISLYRNSGCDLTNASLGGQVNRLVSLETREKVSKSLRGKKQSQESIDKRRKSLAVTWSDPELRELKRKQTTYLNSIGAIGTKGKPSKKKGKPFTGDVLKMSISLKKYYSDKVSPKKIIFKEEQKLINEYIEGNLPLSELAVKYNCARTTITKLMKERGVPFRAGKKTISSERLLEFRESGLKVKDIADKIGCSIANVERQIKKYKVYARNKAA